MPDADGRPTFCADVLRAPTVASVGSRSRLGWPKGAALAASFAFVEVEHS